MDRLTDLCLDSVTPYIAAATWLHLMSVGVAPVFPWLRCGHERRPKRPTGDARENTLRIRLTVAERQLLDDAARSKDLDTSTWGRAELLALARKLLGKNRSTRT